MKSLFFLGGNVLKKKRILKTIGIIFGITILFGIIGTCYFTGISVFNGSMQLADNESTGIEKSKKMFNNKNFDLEEFKSKYTIETIQIESTLGEHMIPADYIIVNGDKDKDTIVLVHGLGGNRWTNYIVADMFLENGYNIITYDQRSSGENTAQYTTGGYLESNDLADCVMYLKEYINDDKKIGIWGTSFGGATAGIYLGSDGANENIDFAILDCPMSNINYMITTEMEQMDTGIPVDFMLSMGSVITKMKLGFSFKDIDVPNHIDKTEVPILVINSRVDEVTPYFMGEDIYNSVPHKNKKIFTVEDSKHAEIFFDYPDEYKSNIFDFIEQIL